MQDVPKKTESPLGPKVERAFRSPAEEALAEASGRLKRLIRVKENAAATHAGALALREATADLRKRLDALQAWYDDVLAKEGNAR